MSTGQQIAHTAPGWPTRFAWLPIPLLLATIAGLWVADLRGVYESRTLMVLLNLVFTWLASLCICILTARGFLGTGQPGLLMFGCGSLVWGVSSLAAAAIVDRVNTTVTVHNVGMLGAALCHFTGLLWRGRVPRPGRWLAVGYSGALVIAVLIVGSALAGLTPLFFVQGQGGTPIRQVVLILATALFAFVALQMIGKYRRQAGSFYYWYGQGLALVATGLTGVVLLSVQGGILGWTNRLTQYLGSAYLFVAAAAAARETGAWEISLAGLEDTWRGNWSSAILWKQPRLWLLLRYGLATGAVAAALWSRLALVAWVGPGLPLYVTFFPAVTVAALLGGLGPGLVATALAGLLLDFCFLSPVGRLAVASPVDRLGLVIFAGMGVFVSFVAEVHLLYRHKAVAYDREAALRASEERYRLLFQSLQEGFYLAEAIFEDQGKCCDAVYLDVNPAFERLMGLSRDQIIGKRVRELVPGIKPEWLDVFGEVTRTGQAMSHQAHSEVFGKHFESFVFRPEPGRVGVLVSDITARKLAEEAVKTSEERFRAAFEGSAVPMSLTASDGKILRVNAAFCEMTGYSETELLARAFYEFTHPDDLGVNRIGVQELLDGTRSSLRLEKRYIRKDGRIIWGDMSSAAVRGADGRPLYMVTHVQDITDRKQSEEKLNESRSAALNLMQDAVESRKQAEQAKAGLERSVAELRAANADLARFNRVAVDRELRMVQLKKQVNELCERLGQPSQYRVEFEKEQGA